MKTYKYRGSADLLDLVKASEKGKQLTSSKDVLDWIRDTIQYKDDNNEIIATYIIDERCYMRIVDRHSEHVVCAGGEQVLSAGEITFSFEDKKLIINEITNQSTGYCPETSSWVSVKEAIEKTGIPAPNQFGREFIFRRCEKCKAINIVKDEWYLCGECDTDLPRAWNFD